MRPCFTHKVVVVSRHAKWMDSTRLCPPTRIDQKEGGRERFHLVSLAPSLSLYVCVCSYLIWQLSATYTHIHIDIDIYTHIQDINKGWLVETNIEIQHRFRLLLPCLPVTQERFNHILHQIKKIPNIYTQQDHHICLSLFLFVFRFWIPFCVCVCVIRRTHRSKNSVACPSQWVVKKLKIKKLLFQSIKKKDI